MKWLWLVLVIALAGAGYYYYHFFQISEPVRYSNDEVYLTRYASMTTPTGVYGFAPGDKLTLLPARRASPGMVSVTDGTHELEVSPDALTRNPAVAQQYADADRSGQTQAVAAAVAAKAHVIKAESDAQLARARDIDRLNAQQRLGAPVPPPTPTPVPALPPRPPGH